MQAIHAATGVNAEVLGQERIRGTLRPGLKADLIVLEANPLEDIANTQRIESTWLEGVQVSSGI